MPGTVIAARPHRCHALLRPLLSLAAENLHEQQRSCPRWTALLQYAYVSFASHHRVNKANIHHWDRHQDSSSSTATHE